jgi:hypothetical protein
VNLRSPADLQIYCPLLPALILAASMPDPLPPVLPDEAHKKFFGKIKNNA